MQDGGAGAYTSSYTRQYTTYSGADIVATFNNVVIGELQAITYSVTREKAPVYTMGSANPRSFSRGKRGIAGSCVFQVFDRDCLQRLKYEQFVQLPHMNRGRDPVHDWNTGMEGAYNDVNGYFMQTNSHYTDEIPPFDITIHFGNEYGNRSIARLFGVEFLNEGMGLSVDDITTESANTFVARDIEYMSAKGNNLQMNG